MKKEVSLPHPVLLNFSLWMIQFPRDGLVYVSPVSSALIELPYDVKGMKVY
jgi:hypothetical protein